LLKEKARLVKKKEKKKPDCNETYENRNDRAFPGNSLSNGFISSVYLQRRAARVHPYV